MPYIAIWEKVYLEFQIPIFEFQIVYLEFQIAYLDLRIGTPNTYLEFQI